MLAILSLIERNYSTQTENSQVACRVPVRYYRPGVIGIDFMIVKDVIWLWKTSIAVCDGERSIVSSRRIKFMLAAAAVYPTLRSILSASETTPMGRQLRDRPEIVGAALWPYQCIGWGPKKRLERIRKHYEIVEGIGGAIDFPIDASLCLLDLSEIRQGLTVVVDHSRWFMREGELVINLFLESTRIYSLAFSFFYNEGERAAFVGAIQGRDIEGILDVYRELTKAAHGMRPRDLLVQLFVMFCNSLGVKQIFAVSDAYRHHRSAYFGKGPKSFSVNYDQIWADRGGELVDPMFYRLKVDDRHKSLEEISPKKRGMYRRRYDMISLIRRQLTNNYNGGEMSPRPQAKAN